MNSTLKLKEDNPKVPLTESMKDKDLDMNLSIDTIKHLLGIKEKVHLTPKEMSQTLLVTFFPFNKTSQKINLFTSRLKTVMKKIGIKIIPFKDVITVVRGKEKINKGVVIVASGESKAGNFPVDYILSFRDNPIVTIVDAPTRIYGKLSYSEYMNIGLDLLAWYMSDLIICVGDKSWMVYSMNGLSPFYSIANDFEKNILNYLIPKIATRVSPPMLNEFKIKRTQHNFIETDLGCYVKDMTESGGLLSKTGLFLSMKKVRELKCKTRYYKCILSLYLDKRRGVSYGFIARQLPLRLPPLVPYQKVRKSMEFKAKDFYVKNNKTYILIEIRKKPFVLEVPPVWVLMSRSGSEKTKLNPYKDIIKVGLENRKMIMVIPSSVNLGDDYKPSFDTKLILSHCLANAIYGSILKKVREEALFPRILENKGLAIAHWHGNLLPEFVPRGWYIYGQENPPVLCSSLQSAIYAFKGKEKAVKNSLLSGGEYLGDIHIEPHHGINVTWPTLKGLGHYLTSVTEHF